MPSLLEELDRKSSANPEKISQEERPHGWLSQLSKSLYYFVMVRTLGQAAAALYDVGHKQGAKIPFVEKGADRFSDWAREIAGVADKNGKLLSPSKDSMLKKIMAWTPFFRDVQGIRETNSNPVWQYGDTQIASYFGSSVPGDPAIPEMRRLVFSRNLINVVESIAFAAVTKLSQHLERDDLLRDFGSLVAHEKGQQSHEITYKDLRQSKNPFVQNEVKKSGQKYWVRYLSDAAFSFGVKTGIIAKTIDYPLEYTAFRQGSPLEDMRKLLRDMHETKLGAAGVGKEALIGGMTRILQTTLVRYKYPKLGADTLGNMAKTVIEPLANEMLADKANLSDFAYVFGALSADPVTMLKNAQERLAVLGVQVSSTIAETPSLEEGEAKSLFSAKHPSKISLSQASNNFATGQNTSSFTERAQQSTSQASGVGH